MLKLHNSCDILRNSVWECYRASHMMFSVICNLSALVLSAISLAANVAVVRVYHSQGPVPDWLQAGIRRLPCSLTVANPRLPCRSYRKYTIESLILSTHSSMMPNDAPAVYGQAEMSPAPNMAQIRIKWCDVARRLDRILFVVFVGINTILIGYFLGTLLVYIFDNRHWHSEMDQPSEKDCLQMANTHFSM